MVSGGTVQQAFPQNGINPTIGHEYFLAAPNGYNPVFNNTFGGQAPNTGFFGRSNAPQQTFKHPCVYCGFKNDWPLLPQGQLSCLKCGRALDHPREPRKDSDDLAKTLLKELFRDRGAKDEKKSSLLASLLGIGDNEDEKDPNSILRKDRPSMAIPDSAILTRWVERQYQGMYGEMNQKLKSGKWLMPQAIDVNRELQEKYIDARRNGKEGGAPGLPCAASREIGFTGQQTVFDMPGNWQTYFPGIMVQLNEYDAQNMLNPGLPINMAGQQGLEHICDSCGAVTVIVDSDVI